MQKLALILFVVSLFACETQTPTTPDNDEGVEQQKEDPHPTKGKACDSDGDCDTFLRCLVAKCEVPPAITGESDENTPTVVFTNGDQEATFFVELALTDAEMSRGLMHRTEMEEDWGMAFIYDGESVRSFWMKNTLIALDMIFVAANGEVVGVVTGAEPLTLTSRSVGIPSRYVVELKAGLATKNGIQRGSTMVINNVDEAYRVQP